MWVFNEMDQAEIQKTAHLAKILIDDAAASDLAKDCNNIMSLIEKMQSVDTDSVEPMAHAYDINQPLREDQVSETNKRESLQENAPKAENGLFLVPKVIE